jgi:class 3 adenylate cyclase
VVPFDRIGLALLDASQGTVSARWARSRAARFVLRGGYSLPLSSTSLGAVAESGKPRIIDDLTEYLTQHPASESTHLMVREGMRSSLTCPLSSDGKTVGFVFFSSSVQNSYQAEHIATYERIADEVSIAVARSHEHDRRASEHHFSESLLTELLPKPVLRSLRHGRGRVADYVPDAGILFVDIQGFTSWSIRTEPIVMVGILDQLFRDFDRCCEGRPVHKLRTIGDAYMVVSGVVDSTPDHFVALADVALQMVVAASKTLDPLGRPVVVRAAIACGAVVAGVLGGKVPHYDVWGPCVNLAARLQAIAPSQRLCVDRASAERLEGRFMLDALGPHELKGVGTLDVFLVERRPVPLT